MTALGAPTRSAVAALLAAALTVACGSALGDPPSAGRDDPAPTATTATPTSTAPSAAPPAVGEPTRPAPAGTLPGGGRSIFPEHRVVAYYGNPQSAAMGVLGETGPAQAVHRVRRAARPFATGRRPVLPAFELIVTVADRVPGPDGQYRHRTAARRIRPWVDAARDNGLLVVLDIQPGRARFLPEAQVYEEFLREPHVGLALDSEWRMPPGEVPGRTIGSVDAAEINEVARWLAGIVREGDLPEKLLLVHQFRESMVRDADDVEAPPGLAVVHHVDGFGTRGQKLEVYDRLAVRRPKWNGLKLFYDEDVDMFAPREVLRLDPVPDFVSYQ